jgi:hypothetical protein
MPWTPSIRGIITVVFLGYLNAAFCLCALLINLLLSLAVISFNVRELSSSWEEMGGAWWVESGTKATND